MAYSDGRTTVLPSEARPEPPFRTRNLDFADAEELGQALRVAKVQIHVAGEERYRGSLLELETEGVGLAWGFHGAATIGHATTADEGAFLAKCGDGGAAHCNGEELTSGVVYYPPGSEHQSRTRGPVGFVTVRVSGLASLAAALAPELDLDGRGRLHHVEDAPEPLARFRALLQDARRTAESGAEALLDPSARRALRETIGAAAIVVLAAGRPQRGRESLASCSVLVRRADELLRSRPTQPVYLSELCAATGASEVRLRRAFLRVYGVGPARYLRMRRLHLVRRALRTTPAAELSVSAAASRQGFFEFGRLAGEYRRMFGELPSETRRTG